MEAQQTKDLPRLVPVPTPELIDDFNQQQEEWRSKVIVPDFLQDPALNKAMVRAIELKELIFALSSIYDVCGGNIPSDLRDRVNLFSRQIAEIYAENGDFLKSLRYALPGDQAELYAAYGRAEDAADANQCEHYKPQYFNGKPVENIFIERDNVPSEKYGGLCSILCCNICQDRNMRPLTADERVRFGGV